MTETFTFTPDDVTPSRAAVFENQGIPANSRVPEPIEALYGEAVGLLAEAAAPVGILAGIPAAAFETVYHGEGSNEGRTPVADIFVLADALSLFAVTLGEPVSRRIKSRFASKDFALGSMLDSAASAATEKAAALLEDRFRQVVTRNGSVAQPAGVLRYSPGYCGWHVSGQKKLFEILQPERIGISLRDSFLMEPLKSISGVVLAGSKEIHCFEMSYPCCSRCEAKGCRERIRALFEE